MVRIAVVALLLSTCCLFASANGASIHAVGQEKEPQPDGAQYKAAGAGSGPLPLAVLNAHPRLDYLGTYNGIFHYIERTSVTQAEARDGCRYLGMELVAPVSQAHLNWISSVTPSSDDYSWSDARLNRNMQSYVYEQHCQNEICTPLSDAMFDSEYYSADDFVGLSISRYTTIDTKFRPLAATTERFYICAGV